MIRSKRRTSSVLACTLFLASLLFYRYFSILLLLSSIITGASLAYYFFRADISLPSFLFVQPADHAIESDDDWTTNTVTCAVCGQKNCPHRPELNLLAYQPWTDTTLPAAVDGALEEFLDIVIQNFIFTWYYNLSRDEEFIDELRSSIRFIVAIVLRRLKRVNVSKFITEKLVKAVIQHVDAFIEARSKSGKHACEDAIIDNYTFGLHCAMHSRRSEVEYIRRVLDKLFPFVLSPQAVHCQSAQALIREVLTGSVILPGLDALADPDMVNNILLIALDKQPPPEATEPPSPRVEVLTHFSQPRASIDSTLHLGMSDVMNRENTRLLYAFMQFLKSEAAINVMQFTLQCEDFNNRILNAELTQDDTQELYAMANELYRSYFSPDAVDKILFPDDVIDELREVTEGPVENVIDLRKKACLFRAFEHTSMSIVLPRRAYEHGYCLLEGTFLPLFHQSDFYFSMLCGGKQTTKQNRSAASTVPGNKLSSHMRPNRKKDFGLSNIGNKIIDVFRTNTDNEKTNWSVIRQYKEFYVLEQKLKEFHGDDTESPLPPRKTLGTRNHEFMDSQRESLELYLQKLLTKPQLKGSQLLHTFLTSETEFTKSFLPDINLGRMIKTVPMILLKEKGQHLDPFLQSFVLSTEAIRPQQGRMERRLSDTSTVSMSSEASDKYLSSLYGNNANMRLYRESPLCQLDSPRLQLDGMFDSLVYVMNRLFCIPGWFIRVLATSRLLFKSTVDSYADWFVSHKLDLVTQEHRVVAIIHLLRDVLFFDTDQPRSEVDKIDRLWETRAEVRAFLPKMLSMIIGNTNFDDGTAIIVDVLQHPKLNKNLSYIFLDLILMELFPELGGTYPH